MTRFWKTAELEETADQLALAGCRRFHDRRAGTLVCKDGEKDVLRAIQKSPGGPWIVRLFSSNNINWEAVP